MIVNPKIPWAHRKPISSAPTWRRVKTEHAPQAGVGGSSWRLTYRGDHLGYVYSTWDRRGVHFRVREPDRGRTVTEEGSHTPRAFATRAEAAMYLLDLFGIDVDEPLDYDTHLGPRGGGHEHTDRRY